MVRVSIADDSLFAWPRDASVGNISPAVAVPIIFAASRRVIGALYGVSVNSESVHEVAEMPYRRYMPLWIAVVS